MTNAPAADADQPGSRRLELAEGRIHYIDEGSGEPVLFVHGTPTWSYEWRHVTPRLSAKWRTIAPDHLGFGQSDRPTEAAYSPEAHADRLRRFVDALGLDRFTLVVHDFGGPIGFPLALAGDGRVTGVVVINTWMWSLLEDTKIRRSARVLHSRLGRFLYRRANVSLRVLMKSAWGNASPLTADVHRAYLERFPDADSRSLVLWPLACALTDSDAFYRSQWDRREALERIPALLVWGMRDSAFGPDYLARWRRALPRAETVELSESGHWPHEEEPARVASAIEAFLDLAS